MPVDPRDSEEIRSTIETQLSNRITTLNNFVETSFNRTFASAYADQLSTFETKLLAVQLSGWVNYVGGPISEADLATLPISFDRPDELDQYLDDRDLDIFARVFDVDRESGARATGTVRIETVSNDTEIPEGTAVAPERDAEDQFRQYFVDADRDGVIDPDSDAVLTPDGDDTHVIAPVIAAEPGPEYNTAQVSEFPAPPAGVRNVEIDRAIDGGEREQTNDDFREDIANAIFRSSGGGTAAGVGGFVDSVVNVNDVYVKEDTYPVEVIVDGGGRNAVIDAIDEAQPSGIDHELRRPGYLSAGAGIDVTTSGPIDEEAVRQNVVDYYLSTDLGETAYREKVIQAVMNADDNIENIETLNLTITTIENERITYDGSDQYATAVDVTGSNVLEEHLYVEDKSLYSLDKWPLQVSGVFAQVNGSNQFLTETAGDLEVVDAPDGRTNGAIRFTGARPDPDTIFSVGGAVQYGSDDLGDAFITYRSGQLEYDLPDFPYARSGFTITNDTQGTNIWTEEQSYRDGVEADVNLVDDNGDGYADTIRWKRGADKPNDGDVISVRGWSKTISVYDVRGYVNDEEVSFVRNRYLTSDPHEEYRTFTIQGLIDGFEFLPENGTRRRPDPGSEMTVEYAVTDVQENDIAAAPDQKIVPDPFNIRVRTYEEQ